jgi:hypothetical protein
MHVRNPLAHNVIRPGTSQSSGGASTLSGAFASNPPAQTRHQPSTDDFRSRRGQGRRGVVVRTYELKPQLKGGTRS